MSIAHNNKKDKTEIKTIIIEGEISKRLEILYIISPPSPLLTKPPEYEINHSEEPQELTELILEYCIIVSIKGDIKRKIASQLKNFSLFSMNLLHLKIK